MRLDLADGSTVTARCAVPALPAPVALTLHADLPDNEHPYLSAGIAVRRVLTADER